MARVYITEKQVGNGFWYFSVRHVVMMLNQVPGRLGIKLTAPFELFHNTKPDCNFFADLCFQVTLNVRMSSL